VSARCHVHHSRQSCAASFACLPASRTSSGASCVRDSSSSRFQQLIGVYPFVRVCVAPHCRLQAVPEQPKSTPTPIHASSHRASTHARAHPASAAVHASQVAVVNLVAGDVGMAVLGR